MKVTKEMFGVFVTGLLILTLGIALTIQSNLGTSPFDALLVGLYHTVGLTIGSWEIVVGFIMIMFNALAQKRKPEFIALLTAFITGLGIDFWVLAVGSWINPTTLIGQYICLGFGVLLTGLGIALYLQANFAPIPMDRMMLVLKELTGLDVYITRAIINIVLVILAFLLDGSIGIGTLIITFIGGVTIRLFFPFCSRIKRNFLRQDNYASVK